MDTLLEIVTSIGRVALAVFLLRALCIGFYVGTFEPLAHWIIEGTKDDKEKE